jgi:hypothetical protein
MSGAGRGHIGVVGPLRPTPPACWNDDGGHVVMAHTHHVPAPPDPATMDDEQGRPAPTPVSPAAVGYRAVAVRPWRVVVIGVAMLVSALTLALELLASIGAALSTTTDRWLWATSWMYQSAHLSTPNGAELGWEWAYGYPPPGLWVALVVTTGCLAAVRVDRVRALRRAGTHIPHLYWSGCEEEARLASSLRRLGASQRMLFRVTHARLLAVAGFASAVTVLLSADAITGRTATKRPAGQAAIAVQDLVVGLGPWLCLAAGVIALAAVVATWPWRPQRQVRIHTGGSVDSLSAFGE